LKAQGVARTPSPAPCAREVPPSFDTAGVAGGVFVSGKPTRRARGNEYGYGNAVAVILVLQALLFTYLIMKTVAREQITY
jgi:hypothetical protein